MRVGGTEGGSRFLAVTVLACGAVAIVVAGLTLAVLRHGTPFIAVPTPSSRPPQSTVPLDITEHLNLGAHHVNAMTVNAGVAWLATHGTTIGDAGTLVRVDAASGRQTATWTVGGDPVSVAAAGDFVWVANSDGGASKVLPGQNTVEQFTAESGALVHVYGVLDPEAVIANPTSALVISASPGQQTTISLLSAGGTTAMTTLPGTLIAPVASLSPQVAVAVCSERMFLALSSVFASGSDVTIYALPLAGGGARKLATIAHDYAAAMSCDATSLFLIVDIGGGDASVARVSVATGTLANLWEGPYPVAVTFVSGRVWIAYLSRGDPLNQSVLTSLDPGTGIAGPTRSILPGPSNSDDPNLLSPGDSGLWTVASQGNVLLHIATG